jgi:hypothetical protein
MERIQELPATGRRLVAGASSSFWDEYATKGFHAYHWDGDGAYDESRHYERYVAPPVPINVSQLPPELQAVAYFAEFM